MSTFSDDMESCVIPLQQLNFVLVLQCAGLFALRLLNNIFYCIVLTCTAKKKQQLITKDSDLDSDNDTASRVSIELFIENWIYND